MSSLAISSATRNCSIAPLRISQRTACAALCGRPSISSSLSIPHARNRSSRLYLGQWSRTWRTVWAAQPHWHAGVTPGTCTDASHTLRPMTSVLIKNKAVASDFVRPAYSMRGSCSHGVSQVAGGLSRGFIASFSQAAFHLSRSLRFSTASRVGRRWVACAITFPRAFSR